MRKVSIKNKTELKVNKSYEGEPLEHTLARITTTKEPIEATSPQMYTERSQGVLPETDIRTDRWEIAREAMDKVHKTQIAKRTESFKKEEKPSESTQATVNSDATE